MQELLTKEPKKVTLGLTEVKVRGLSRTRARSLARTEPCVSRIRQPQLIPARVLSHPGSRE